MEQQTESPTTTTTAATDQTAADPLFGRILRRIAVARAERNAEQTETATVLDRIMSQAAADQWCRDAVTAMRAERPPWNVPSMDTATALAILRDIANA